MQSTYYSTASATISISNSGVAIVSGKITGILGTTTKTYIQLSLQMYKSGAWETITTWSSTGYTVNRTLTKSESITKYSSSVSY